VSGLSHPPPLTGRVTGRAPVARPVDGHRRRSLAVLLDHLRVTGPLSRAELTALMGLNRSTIAALVTELTGLGAVGEERPGGMQTGAGRPSLVVRTRRDRLYVLAAEVAVEHVSIALIGLDGAVRGRRVAITPAEPTLERVVAVLSELAAELAPAPSPRVVGLGVAVPGAVRRTDGCVRFAPNLAWVDVPFGRALSAALPGLHVVVANDADLGALAEHRRGVARDVDEVVFVRGDVGVGAGLIMGGLPLVGAGGYAGEIGHMSVRPDGLACRCGSRGCWETEVGAAAIARALHVRAKASHELVAAVRGAREAGYGPELEALACWLGLGIGSVVNLVNPSLVVVDGVLQELLLAAPDAVRAALDATALRANGEQVRLARPQLGPDVVLAGAAEVVWQNLLADPVAVLSAVP
jgi:predicted NBD/HSP70 family sugar kinase